jgi:hypothetical protein
VLLLPGDLFYYREHSGQIFQEAGVARQYASVPRHLWEALSSSECPLDDDERDLARRNVAFSVAKAAWHAARRGDWSLAAHRLSASGIGAGDWTRYLRRPRRSTAAGIGRPAGSRFQTKSPV